MLFLDGKSLEAFEPKELIRLKKKVKLFDRLGLAALFGGGAGVIFGLAAGVASVVGPYFGLGDGSLAGAFFTGAFFSLGLGAPAVLSAALKWEKWSIALKAKQLEITREENSDPPKRQLESDFDSYSDCDLDDPFRYYAYDHSF